jgi:hypothetical protein
LLAREPDAVDGLALADRQLLLGQPGPALDAEEVDAGGRPFKQRTNTA